MKIRIAVCDAGRLRYFAADKANGALREIDSRVHTASRQRPRDLVSDRQGRDRGRGGGVHSLGDGEPHRQAVVVFAREVAELLNREALEGSVDRLYVLAPPEFLGMLRKEFHPATAALVADRSVNVVTESLERIRRQLPEFL